MNTNEFYKELMSEYSFDYDKIRKAAMGKSVQAKKSRLKTVWLSVAGGPSRCSYHIFKRRPAEFRQSCCCFTDNLDKCGRPFQNGYGGIQQGG